MNQTPPEHVKKSGILYTLDGWHREFDYVTACYLLEPWERRIVKDPYWSKPDCHNMEKKEELFHKLDKRHEKHQEIKDRNREARRDADESKTFLQHLNDWIVKINDSIDEEIEKKNTYIGQKILDEISEDMQKLDSYFIEHSSALKKFDMKKVQESILDLRSKFDELHRVLIPKKKFGFKGNKMKKAIVSNASLKDSTSSTNQDQEKKSEKTEEFGFALKNITDQTIELESEKITGQDVMLSNLSNCTVIMKSNPITLHMTHLENCTLWMGPVQTSIYVDQCNLCQFSLACQQLRAHNSTNCKFYLHVTSKGIIEDCKKIQVAPYNFVYGNLDNQYTKLGLDPGKNNWDQLDDFNWLASEQSPNWSILPYDERTDYLL